jgi:hypothetical protein
MHCMTKDMDGADMMDDGSIRLHACKKKKT